MKKSILERHPFVLAMMGYALVLVMAYPEIILGGLSLNPMLLYPFGISANTWSALGLRVPMPTFHVEMATAAYYELPMNEFIGRWLRHGILPLWNPYQSAGGSLLGQYSTKLFFPYQLIENFAGPLWYDLFFLGRLYSAGIGTFLLITALGGSGLSAFAAGVIYMLSGVFTIFNGLEQMTNAAFVLPFLLWSSETLLRKPGPRWLGATALMVALFLYAGQPEVALYGFFLAGLFFLVRWSVISRRRVDLAYGGTALVLGFAIAAPQLIPFYYHLSESMNLLHAPGANVLRSGTASPTPFGLFPFIFFPTLGTLPLDPRIVPANGFWDSLGGYVGGVVPVLLVVGSIVALRQKKDESFWTLLFCIAFPLLILLKNGGVYPFWLLGTLPFFDQAWSPRWAGPAWTLSLSIAAGLSFDYLKKLDLSALSPNGRFLRALLVLCALAGASAFLFAMTPESIRLFSAGYQLYPEFEFPSFYLGLMITIVAVLLSLTFILNPERFPLGQLALIGTITFSLIFVIPRGLASKDMTSAELTALAGLLGSLCLARRWHKVTGALVALSVGGLLWVSVTAKNGLPHRANAFTRLPYMTFLDKQVTDFSRVVGGQGVWMGNSAGALGHSDLQGIWALPMAGFCNFYWHFLRSTPAEMRQALYWFYGASRPDEPFVRLIPEKLESLLPYYSMLAARHFVLPSSLPPTSIFGRFFSRGEIERIYQDGQTSIYSNSWALPRAFLASFIRPTSSKDLALALKEMGTLSIPARTALVDSTLRIKAEPALKSDVSKLVSLEPNYASVTVKSVGPRLLVLSDHYASGWTARIDGIPYPILQVNGFLRGVEVPEGHHFVEFNYFPPGLAAGLLAATAAIVLLFLFSIWRQVFLPNLLKRAPTPLVSSR